MNFKTLQDMKKNLLFFVAIASMLALVSCSQDTTEMADKGNVIKFRTSVSGITRSMPLYSITTFKVTAFIDGLTTGNYFTNLTASKDNTNEWKLSHEEYWPGSGTLRFFAYYPTTIEGSETINQYEQIIKGLTVPAKDDQQSDVIVACNSGTRVANESSGIDLKFQHILSQIDVKVRNIKTENYQIDVKNMKLVGFKTRADFVFPTSSTASAISLSNWKNASMEGYHYSYRGNSNSIYTLTNNYYSLVDTYFMVIPQQLTAWNKTASKSGAYIALLMRIYNKDGSNKQQIFPKMQGRFAYVAVPIDTKLEPGKKYTFNLTFMENGAGNIAPDQTNPENIDVVDPNPGTGGDLVIGGPIKVSVTVSDWGDNNYIDKNP